MARKRAFAYRRCRRGTNCPLLPDAHKCSRVPNLGRHFSCELCDLHAHQTSIGVVRQAAIPVIRTMVGFAGGLVGGLTAMPGSLPIIWCDLRGVSKEHQRG